MATPFYYTREITKEVTWYTYFQLRGVVCTAIAARCKNVSVQCHAIVESLH